MKNEYGQHIGIGIFLKERGSPHFLAVFCVFSLIFHILVFAFFGFSFGAKLDTSRFPVISSLGAILFASDLLQRSRFMAANEKRIRDPRLALSNSARDTYPMQGGWPYLKPAAEIQAFQQKKVSLHAPVMTFVLPQRQEPVMMFYPLLPLNFTLYFRDKQPVYHIELTYNITHKDNKRLVLLKRKISSGNLDVDLLVTRYIGHYLFLQPVAFTTNTWQAVKIDLSPKKND